jgi:hypothetical protein
MVTGILSSSPENTSITNNTIYSLNNSYIGTAPGSGVRGIVTSAGVNTISGNTVRNLNTTSQDSAPGFSASVIGILQSSTTANQIVSQNAVHSIADTQTGGSTSVYGIYYSGPTSGTNVIARNLVHSLTNSSSSASAQLVGIYCNAGAFTVQNNMVMVGLDASGVSTASTLMVSGILDAGTSIGRNFYHNSVYVGGTHTSGTSSTFAYQSTGATNLRNFQNNIFVNMRSTAAGSSKHYAVQYGGSAPSPSGLTANNNLFFASGTGGVIGRYNSVDQTTLTAWRTATGVDANSLNSDPLYNNPTGTSATVNLHIQGASPANNAGAPISGITSDFDGQPRNATTPDIGADETGSDANLSALTVSSNSITPVFNSNTLAYATVSDVANTVTQARITPTPADPGATVTINGASPTSLVSLNVGSNLFNILVTAQEGGASKNYTLTINRRSTYQEWALANSISQNPNTPGANGQSNVLNFGFGISPSVAGTGPLQYTGTLAGSGTIASTGTPITRQEGTDLRALFVRRKDYATVGLTYTVQFSAGLSSWQDSTNTPTVLADDGTNQIVSVPYPAGFTAAGFFRVSVTLP